MKAKRNRNRLISILAIAAIVIAAVLGGSLLIRQRVRAQSAPADDQTVTVFVGDLTSGISTSGHLLPQRQARLTLSRAGTVQAVYVAVGDAVQAGQVLLQLDGEALTRSVLNAEQTLAIQEANLADLLKPAAPLEIAASQAALDSAQAQLDDLLAGPTEEQVAQAQAALNSALAALRAAQVRYATGDDQLAIARQSLDNAQTTLDAAQLRYDSLVNNWQTKDWAPYSPQAEQLENAKTNYQVALAQYNVKKAEINDSSLRSAEAQVAQAQANLASLLAPKTTQIASARAQVAQAQLNLDKLQQGATQERIAVAKAQVEQSRLSLQEAQANLDNATLVAPFAGVITAVNVAQGEWASGIVVELIDLNSLQVVLDVDEIDIGGIVLGQEATITLETWPDRPLSGQVVYIAPQAKRNADIITYQVHLSVEAGDLPLRAGLTANAELITARREEALLVPNRAIVADRQSAKYYVNLKRGDQISQVEVKIGLRDNGYTEILSGLKAGDQLVIADATSGLPFGMGGSGTSLWSR